ncbi:MAG: shikimate kinase [Pseudomonadota bacterium]
MTPADDHAGAAPASAPSAAEATEAAPVPPAAPAGLLRRPVVLVGLMGAGKTTVGRRLAAQLHAPFVDSDEAVEDAARMSVAEIFETMGEAAFRDGERKVIARLLTEAPQVVATGGGAWMNEATRAEIRACAATVVWLRADLDVLVERVGRRAGRPLLAGGDPREILSRLMAQRNPVYETADLAVESRGDERHEAVVERMMEALRRRGDVTG